MLQKTIPLRATIGPCCAFMARTSKPAIFPWTRPLLPAACSWPGKPAKSNPSPLRRMVPLPLPWILSPWAPWYTTGPAFPSPAASPAGRPSWNRSRWPSASRPAPAHSAALRPSPTAGPNPFLRRRAIAPVNPPQPPPQPSLLPPTLPPAPPRNRLRPARRRKRRHPHPYAPLPMPRKRRYPQPPRRSPPRIKPHPLRTRPRNSPPRRNPAPSRQQSPALLDILQRAQALFAPQESQAASVSSKPRPPSPSPTPSPGIPQSAWKRRWNIPAGPATICGGGGGPGRTPIPSMPYPASMPRFPASPASAAPSGRRRQRLLGPHRPQAGMTPHSL